MPFLFATRSFWSEWEEPKILLKLDQEPRLYLRWISNCCWWFFVKALQVLVNRLGALLFYISKFWTDWYQTPQTKSQRINYLYRWVLNSQHCGCWDANESSSEHCNFIVTHISIKLILLKIRINLNKKE